MRGDEAQASLQSARRQRDFGGRVAEKIGIFEGAFAGQALGVDRQPSAFAAVEDVGVVKVAVKGDALAR